jgi:hypothetical protein
MASPEWQVLQAFDGEFRARLSYGLGWGFYAVAVVVSVAAWGASFPLRSLSLRRAMRLAGVMSGMVTLVAAFVFEGSVYVVATAHEGGRFVFHENRFPFRRVRGQSMPLEDIASVFVEPLPEGGYVNVVALQGSQRVVPELRGVSLEGAQAMSKGIMTVVERARVQRP